MSVDSTAVAFAEIVEKLLTLPGVSYPPSEAGKAKGFGSKALKVRGKIFAMVDVRGRFVVKLPESRVLELLSDGRGGKFAIGKARWVKEWVCLKPGTEGQWLGFAQEALDFVSGLASGISD